MAAFTRWAWGMMTMMIVAAGTSNGAGSDGSSVAFQTRDALFRLDGSGSLRAIERRRDGRNYLVAGQPTPILSLRIAGKLYAPVAAAWSARSRTLTLRYLAPDPPSSAAPSAGESSPGASPGKIAFH